MLSFCGQTFDLCPFTPHVQQFMSATGDALLSHIRLYDGKGFTVNTVTTDGEPAIVAIKSTLAEADIRLNGSAVGEGRGASSTPTRPR
jgi:hypothetical protein